MQKTTTRWGIMGAAQIARKNWLAIANSGNGTVTAVASRRVEAAEEFISDCQKRAAFAKRPRAIGGYEALLAAPDIDAVYIPLPTGLRKEWVIAAARAGKHVLCEKPCAPTTADLEGMVAGCRKYRVQFMDGVMFMHSTRLEAMRAAMPKAVGRVRRMTLAFSFNVPKDFFVSNIRGDSELEPLGCLGDLGWYCVRFALWTMTWKMPRSVAGRMMAETKARAGRRPVPLEFSGELFFDGGVSAAFYCSFQTANQQLAIISGDKGYMRLNDFVLPFAREKVGFETCASEFEMKGCDFDMLGGLQRKNVAEKSNSDRSSQETRMFRDFAAQIQSGRLNTEWPEMALKTQRVLEECLKASRKI